MHTDQKIHLLVLDPQNDFCDIDESDLPVDPKSATGHPVPLFRPALPVTGADADMKRLAGFIDRFGEKLHGIHVTMDSHNPVDIAHPAWWVNDKGESPAPFTPITTADVKNGVYKARNPANQAHSLRYVEALDAGGRYLLVVWPEHCLIGSWGNNVHHTIKNALDRWARRKLETVDFVSKGSNPLTEHYSALRAEVPDPADPSTMLNARLIQTLGEADRVIIAGEALSHCVANTVRDIADSLGDDKIGKIVLLTDCTSAIAGFEDLTGRFLSEMTARGMKTTVSTNFPD